ncbi:MAG: hypothetical protein HC817_06785 [Saprospiraceae bacterium]|nr:hypothetical protein [Saprospiraceae bacterium]
MTMNLLRINFWFSLFLTFTLIFPDKLVAQIPAPDFRCVKGDTLLWDLPTVTCGNITGFRIFSSQSFSGPYQLLATVTNPTQTTFRNLNGGGNRLYYYLETIANCGAQTSRRSDTLDNEIPYAHANCNCERH